MASTKGINNNDDNAPSTSSSSSSTSLFVLGLTGSIGMGKSTVASMFASQNIPVLDADAIVRDLYAPGGAAVGPVSEAFPGCLSSDDDGETPSIDRAKLGALVVGKSDAMDKLNGIVHPLVERERQRWLEAALARGEALAVLDVPLLFETGGEAACDAVAVVSAPAEVQRSRVLARPGMTPEKFEGILARQLPDAEKRKRADFVVDTGVSVDETEAHVVALIDGIRGRRGAGKWRK